MSVGFNSSYDEERCDRNCSEPNLESLIYKLTQRVSKLEKKVEELQGELNNIVKINDLV